MNDGGVTDCDGMMKSMGTGKAGNRDPKRQSWALLEFMVCCFLSVSLHTLGPALVMMTKVMN